MPKIYELDPHVADLIAAGEVVERPASVVKELMENSIDAGAGIITVEITAGGMTYIRVTDNGGGIAPEDVKTAFLRHATSKLSGAEGLEAIDTLGFRGEALAAIAAVSRIELLTREPGASEGVNLSLSAGETVNMSPAGCPEGTTIIVRDLFFNTPARLKFMKSDRTESSAAASAALRCALARPDVSVRLIRDGKTEYHTPGDSRVDSCIYSLLGREFSAGLLGAETSDEAVTVSGFVSAPAAARGNRSYQFFFVNGRPIRSITLQAALEQAYANMLPSGRFPSCVLYVTIKPCNVDVNVHPAKTEVKFISDKQVFDGVYYAALGALQRVRREAVSAVNPESVIPNSESESETSGAAIPYNSGNFKTMQVDEYRRKYSSDNPRRYGKTEDVRSKRILPQSASLTAPSRREPTPLASDHLNPSLTFPRDSESSISNSGFPDKPFRVIGEAFHTYIMVEYQDSVWFIDKHAAHERIHFDALKKDGFEPMSQSLITPVVCRHGHEDVSILLENTELLEKLGFTAERFGDNTIAVRRIPAEIDISDTETVLSEICAQLKAGGPAEPKRRDNIFRSIACKAAIKAGRSSGRRELEILTAKVISGEVSLCPHGRPVAFEITKGVTDKWFNRS